MEPPCSDTGLLIVSRRSQALEDRDGTVGVHDDRAEYQLWDLKPSKGGNLKTAKEGGFFIISHRNQALEDRIGVVGVHDDRAEYQEWTLKPVTAGWFLLVSHLGHALEDLDGKVGLHDGTGESPHPPRAVPSSPSPVQLPPPQPRLFPGCPLRWVAMAFELSPDEAARYVEFQASAPPPYTYYDCPRFYPLWGVCIKYKNVYV